MSKAAACALGLLMLAGCAAPSEQAGTEATTTTQREEEAPQEPTEETEPEAEAGDRESPFPMNRSWHVSDEWAVNVLGTTPNANAAVQKENQFNDPPAEGNQFFMVNVEITYQGEGSGSRFLSLQFGVAGSDNKIYSENEDGCGVTPNGLSQNKELLTGGSDSGNICFEVPSEVVDSLLLAVNAYGDNYFFALL